MNENDVKKLIEGVERAIEKTVNGKIKALHDEVSEANRVQNEKIDELMTVFKDTSAFFRISIKIAQFILPVGGAIAMFYGVVRWIRGG